MEAEMATHNPKAAKILSLALLGSGYMFHLISAEAQELKATAVLSPTSVASAAGMNPQGTVNFVERGDVVFVSGRITGLRPSGEHGFHVHEAADCTDDGMATRGHFNPSGTAHGRHGDHTHHVGDLVSLKADASGVAEFSFETKLLRVSPGQTSIIGRGLIVHRDADDYTTQPTGNAGPRPGCAVIRAN
jgi:Cu-Zn family superoxide dismutase